MSRRAGASGLFMSRARIWKEGFIIFWKCRRTALTGGGDGIVSPPADPQEEEENIAAKAFCQKVPS